MIEAAVWGGLADAAVFGGDLAAADIWFAGDFNKRAYLSTTSILVLFAKTHTLFSSATSAASEINQCEHAQRLRSRVECQLRGGSCADGYTLQVPGNGDPLGLGERRIVI